MNDSSCNFPSYIVRKSGDSTVAEISSVPMEQFPDGDVEIDVHYSALNYKDALAASGHPGVALSLPLIPGIDAVGRVLTSNDERFQIDQEVLVSGADFGTKSFGGWSSFCRVPADYCIPVPDGMTSRESVILGTAGFTAAHSVEKLQHHGVKPEDGPILVTGATGGVGVFAVKLLSKLGYHVVASTGKMDRTDWLKEQGAIEVVDRTKLVDESKSPLLSAKWAGAIDSVGGETLTSVLRATKLGGCVTCCGLVAGHKMEMTVYPFILRGVCLQGIDSANADVAYRHQLWQRLATDWKLDDLESLATEVALADVQESVDAILAGKIAGRHLVSTK